jgi:hypothetical protein
METNSTPLAQFTTNSFVGNPIGVIVLGTAVGMGFMFVGILLGAPIYLSMALLFGGIGLVYGYMIGKVQYTLLPNGVEQRIRKFIPYYLNKKEETRFIKWEQINSFKNDTDFSRQVKEYEYIKLYLNVPPREIWITDQIDPIGFNVFKSAFLLRMQEFIPQPKVASLASVEANNPYFLSRGVKSTSGKQIEIKEKKSFYKTTLAKIITIVFVLVAIGIALVGVSVGMRTTNWIKFGIIILPGTFYMVSRVFIRGNN